MVSDPEGLTPPLRQGLLKAAPPFSVVEEELSLAPDTLLAGSRHHGRKIMRSKLAFVVAFAFAATSLALPALAQKQGGTMRIYHRDNLPSASIHEEATISTVQPFMGIFNNLVVFDQQKQLNTPETHRAGPRRELGLGRGQDQADLQAAPGRQMARRQAVHGQGRRVHLEQADRQGQGRLPQEPARHLVAQPQGHDGQRRPRDHLQSQPAATLVRLAVRLGLHPGLSLPRLDQGHAHQSRSARGPSSSPSSSAANR